ncbi:hypothetical protein [uncultured Roseobacter sp.]|uniref:hypothetical protein n=1 Tax=uncultured Roseobacter sp. TaxID=114847 RepID=UPI002602108E|nr:hypothetical protein [uncultured Roseobacter sp.]
MIRRIATLILVASVAAILFYLSRFWYLTLWPRPGLFGSEALRPQGDLVGQWLRGTSAAPFDLVIWALGCFACLSILQKLYDALTKPSETDPPQD